MITRECGSCKDHGGILVVRMRKPATNRDNSGASIMWVNRFYVVNWRGLAPSGTVEVCLFRYEQITKTRRSTTGRWLLDFV